jgi:hypothetical protein
MLSDGLWAGRPCVVIGGGSSIRHLRWGSLDGWLTLGLNAAFTRNPTANLVLDYRLMERLEYDKNWAKYAGHKAWIAYEKERRHLINAMANVQKLRPTQKFSGSLTDGLYRGSNAGIAGLNLACLLGASPIYLIGYDMRGKGGRTSQWHDYYPIDWRPNETVYERYLRDFDEQREAFKPFNIVNLEVAGVESALNLFKKEPIESVLGAGCTSDTKVEDVIVVKDETPPDARANLSAYLKVSDNTKLPSCHFCGRPRTPALEPGHRSCDLEDRLRRCYVNVANEWVIAFKPEEAKKVAEAATFPVNRTPIFRPSKAVQRDPKPDDMPPPFTIVIGCMPKDRLPALVLEYTIRRKATIPLRIIHSADRELPTPADDKNRARTGFSFARLAVPQWCGYSGRSAYMDSDMIVFSDVRELAELSFPDGVGCLRPPNITSVLVYDCDRLDWEVYELVNKMNHGHYSYSDLVGKLHFEDAKKIHIGVPVTWNVLDRWVPETKLLHYTNIPSQPWRFDKHPFGELWYDSCAWAVRDGFIPPSTVEKECQAGHVAPWVWEKVKNRLAEE